LFHPANSAVHKPGGNVVAMPDSGLFASAKPVASGFAALRRVVLPVVIRRQERSIAGAQLRR